MIKLYPEASIDGIELHLRQPDHLLPDGDIFSVAGLKFDQFLLGFLQSSGVRVALGIDDFVEALQFGDCVQLECRAIEHLFPPEKQFAELRAPIADMIVRDDIVPQQS